MSANLPLHEMSLEEKLQAMEALWEDRILRVKSQQSIWELIIEIWPYAFASVAAGWIGCEPPPTFAIWVLANNGTIGKQQH